MLHFIDSDHNEETLKESSNTIGYKVFDDNGKQVAYSFGEWLESEHYKTQENWNVRVYPYSHNRVGYIRVI